MRKKFFVIFWLLHIPFFLAQSQKVWAKPDTITIITDVQENNQIIYYQYKPREESKINISDLILWDQFRSYVYSGKQFQDVENIRIYILQNGYAKLSSQSTASIQEKQAETLAKEKQAGIWRPSPIPIIPTPDNPIDRILKNFSINKEQIPLIIGTIVGGIVILFIFIPILYKIIRYLYRKFLLTKRIALFMIGETSAGKTSLATILTDPKITKEQILQTKITKGKAKLEKETYRPIHIGKKIDLIPVAKDYQGSSYSLSFDDLIQFKKSWFSFFKDYILLLVIAPSKSNQSNNSKNGTNIEKDIDREYINKQSELLLIYSDIAFKSKNTKSPLAVILFVSKFDLFSKEPPNDSSARNVKEQIEEIFKDPISRIKGLAESSKTDVKIVIGSSSEKWGREEILDFISQNVLF